MPKVSMKRLLRWNPDDFEFPPECPECHEPQPGMGERPTVCETCQRERAASVQASSDDSRSVRDRKECA